MVSKNKVCWTRLGNNGLAALLIFSLRVGNMQPSAAAFSTMQTSTQNSTKKTLKTPSNIQIYDRTMAVPNLSPSVTVANSPSPRRKVNSATTLDSLDSGGNISAEESNHSDRSSICRSPSWENTERKKRKKARQEAKQKQKCEEKERAALEARRQRPQKRLTKVPPQSRSMSKFSSSLVSSQSEPMLSNPATSANGYSGHSEDTSISDAASGGSTAWMTAKTKEGENGQSHMTGGFIGGVKLEQVAHATVQDTIQKHKASDPRKSKFAEQFSVGDQNLGTLSSFRGDYGSVPHQVQLNGEAYDQKSLSSRASTKVQGSIYASQADLPSLERKNERGRSGGPSISSTAYQQASVSLPHLIPGPESTRASEVSRPPVSYREPPQLAEVERRGHSRRGSFSLPRFRQSSRDRSVAADQPAAQVPDGGLVIAGERPRFRRLSWSFGRSGKSASAATQDTSSSAHESSKPASFNKHNGASTQVTVTATQGNEIAKRELPRINTAAANPSLSVNPHDLHFLPAPKHQHLPRPVSGKSHSFPTKNSDSIAQNASASESLAKTPSLTPPESSSTASSSPPSPINVNNVNNPSPPAQYLQTARKNLAPSASASASRLSPAPSSSPKKDPVAKVFVICCGCHYYHDMPSKVYECMAKPDNVVRDQVLGVGGVVGTHVKCPWCRHGMSWECCESWTAVVLMQERLH